MIRPDATHTETARLLFAHEAAAGASDATAAGAAARVYDKLLANVGPLVADAGVRMLLTRSARLAGADYPWLVKASFDDGSAKLHACLQAEEPDVAAASAIALFATFIALLGTFIGERLTLQALRSAWPTVIDAKTSTEPRT